MATCKECLHYEACGYYLPTDTDKDVWDLCARGLSDEIADIENRCATFEDKTKYVEQTNEHKCTKRENSYSFYVRCTCGAELNVDIFYWDYFKLCPNCGTKMDGERGSDE